MAAPIRFHASGISGVFLRSGVTQSRPPTPSRNRTTFRVMQPKLWDSRENISARYSIEVPSGGSGVISCTVARGSGSRRVCKARRRVDWRMHAPIACRSEIGRTCSRDGRRCASERDGLACRPAADLGISDRSQWILHISNRASTKPCCGGGLDQADAESLDVYLESSDDGLRLYEKNGCELVSDGIF